MCRVLEVIGGIGETAHERPTCYSEVSQAGGGRGRLMPSCSENSDVYMDGP